MTLLWPLTHRMLSAAVKDVRLKVTNAELITMLQKLPPEAPALRGDPEWGILHVKDVQLTDVIISADSMREVFDGSGEHLNDDETLVRCVVLR
jgi:hypothetical protein